MKKLIIFSLLVVLTAFVASCTAPVPVEKQCTVDADCERATCCHADDAVNTQFAPDCAKVLCTAECVPGTLDCQQGEIKCVVGECKAVIVS